MEPSTRLAPDIVHIRIDDSRIYHETAGDFRIPLEAVDRVHDGKVMVDVGRLDAYLHEAIAHAHDREEPGA
jgi:hypothetical protein